MPIVRSPCTFEWPRTGIRPAPGRPMLPRSIITFDSNWIVRTDSLCCVSPMPQQAIVRSLWT
jgi:hypothetical protein